MKKYISQKKGFLFGILLTSIMLQPNIVFGAYTKTIQVVMDSIDVIVHQQPTDIHTMLYNGTTYIPLRDVSEHLGYQVAYHNDTAYIGDNIPNFTNISERKQVSFTEEEVKEINLFLSNFSEANFYDYSSTQYAPENLINFAGIHHILNNKSYIQYDDFGVYISANHIHETLKRYLGIDIPEQSSNYFYYKDGKYYTNPDNLNIQIQAVTNIPYIAYQNADGSYTVQGIVCVLSSGVELNEGAYTDIYYRGGYDSFIDYEYNIEATFTKNGSDMKLLKYTILDDVG